MTPVKVYDVCNDVHDGGDGDGHDVPPPALPQLVKCLRWLTSEPAVLPAIKEAGAISVLVPLLTPTGVIGSSRAANGSVPPQQSLAEMRREALNALYNICMYDKKVGGMSSRRQCCVVGGTS